MMQREPLKTVSFAVVPNGLAAAVADEFRRGLSLITSLGDAEYVAAIAGQGSIGAHIRHNIDHANCLLSGIANRRIDYTARRRDSLIEVDRELASIEIRGLIERLSAIPAGIENAFVSVRAEASVDVWSVSTIGR